MEECLTHQRTMMEELYWELHNSLNSLLDSRKGSKNFLPHYGVSHVMRTGNMHYVQYHRKLEFLALNLSILSFQEQVNGLKQTITSNKLSVVSNHPCQTIKTCNSFSVIECSCPVTFYAY